MKNTLKMQGVHLATGMKILIDYYNENYTKKKEYICKDLKPTRMLNENEYNDFSEEAGGVNPQEIHYYPLFKASKIKNNRPRDITYILKTDNKKYEGVMRRVSENVYDDDSVRIIMNRDEIALNTYDIINTEAYFLTLYIDSLELPKLEYPKNKMDMYRAINFITTIACSINDSLLHIFIGNYFRNDTVNLYPNNIDEIDLYLDNMLSYDMIDLRKNAYFINSEKDNYYTVLDAIKKGKTIYRNLDTPLVYWEINKEEKWIKFNRNIAIANETGWVDLES